MPILAINTASSKTAIALLQDGGIVAQDSWQSQNDEAEKLMPNIDDLLKNNKTKYEDIKKVLVVKGPGSFTGLRVGVTVANTIAHLVNCELYGIDTFSYWWHAGQQASKVSTDQPTGQATEQSTTSNEKTALLVFAGKGGVYLSLAPEKSHKKSDYTKLASTASIVNLPDLNEQLKKNSIQKVFGDITDEQKSTIQEAQFIETKKTFGEIIQKIDLSKFKNEKIIKPTYIKQPSITVSKKQVIDN